MNYHNILLKNNKENDHFYCFKAIKTYKNKIIKKQTQKNISKIFQIESCPIHIVSFQTDQYIYFITVLIINYTLIRILNIFFEWENRIKTIENHLQDIFSLLVYGTLLFTYGNYAETFDWWTIVFVFINGFIFSCLSNINVFKSSLISIKYWNIETWIITSILLFIIICIAFYILWLSKKCAKLKMFFVFLLIRYFGLW